MSQCDSARGRTGRVRRAAAQAMGGTRRSNRSGGWISCGMKPIAGRGTRVVCPRTERRRTHPSARRGEAPQDEQTQPGQRHPPQSARSRWSHAGTGGCARVLLRSTRDAAHEHRAGVRGGRDLRVTTQMGISWWHPYICAICLRGRRGRGHWDAGKRLGAGRVSMERTDANKWEIPSCFINQL